MFGLGKPELVVCLTQGLIEISCQEFADALWLNERTNVFGKCRDQIDGSPTCQGITGNMTEPISQQSQFGLEFRGFHDHGRNEGKSQCVALRDVNFVEIPGVSEPMLLGAPTLAKLGFGLSMNDMQLNKLDMAVPFVPENIRTDRQLVVQEFACLIGPTLTSVKAVDRGSRGVSDSWFVDSEEIGFRAVECQSVPDAGSVDLVVAVLDGHRVQIGPHMNIAAVADNSSFTFEARKQAADEGEELARQNVKFSSSPQGVFDRAGGGKIVSIRLSRKCKHSLESLQNTSWTFVVFCL